VVLPVQLRMTILTNALTCVSDERKECEYDKHCVGNIFELECGNNRPKSRSVVEAVTGTFTHFQRAREASFQRSQVPEKGCD
jgi:hypothetical protein